MSNVCYAAPTMVDEYVFADVTVRVRDGAIDVVVRAGTAVERPRGQAAALLAVLLVRADAGRRGESHPDFLRQHPIAPDTNTLSVVANALRNWASDTLGIEEFVAKRSLSLVPHVKRVITMPTGAMLVPPAPELLIGRTADLDLLKNRLLPRSAGEHVHALSALRGLGGIGKSALAVSFAHDADVWTAYPDGILWCTLGVSPSLEGVLSAWARALQEPDVLKAPGAPEMAKRLSAVIASRRVLVVIDDVWDAEHVAPLAPLLHLQNTGALFTTRVTGLAESLADSPQLISELTPEYARELMEQVAPELFPTHEAQALDVARAHGFVPLALILAARGMAYDVRAGLPLDAWRDLSALLDERIPLDMVGAGAQRFELLLARNVTCLTTELQERFALLSRLPAGPTTFAAVLCKLVWNDDDVRTSLTFLRALHQRGLVELVPGGTYRIHPSLHAYAKHLREHKPS